MKKKAQVTGVQYCKVSIALLCQLVIKFSEMINAETRQS